LFNNKRRLASAWAKGLMLGKAVGARDERDRIIALLEQRKSNHTALLSFNSNRNDDAIQHTICRTLQTSIELIKGDKR